METLRLMLEHPAFAAGDRDRMRELAAKSEVRTYDRGRAVIVAGAVQRHVLLVLSGALELYRRSLRRRANVLLGLIEPPTLFGDATLFGGTIWPVSARAFEDTLLVRIPARSFTEAVDADGALAAGLYRASCQRHFRAIQIRKFLVLHSTEDQVLRLLWDLAPIHQGESPVVRLSKSRLARALGVDRTTIMRVLHRLEERGFLRLERSGAVLLEKSADVDDAPGLVPVVTPSRKRSRRTA